MPGVVLMPANRPGILRLDKNPWTLSTTWDQVHGAALAAVTTSKAVGCTVDDPAMGTHPGISAIFLIG
jgi:hypothetical protein